MSESPPLTELDIDALLISANFTAPTGVECTIYFKTVEEGKRFHKWLGDTLEAAYKKGYGEAKE